MNVSCPECETSYRLDPAKIPGGGVRVRCARCPNQFSIGEVRGESGDGSLMSRKRGGLPGGVGSDVDTQDTIASFGSEDSRQRAARMARVLVSDIKAYNPDRWERSVQAGTLKREFRDEIRKSWEEYNLKVGNEIANETSYFRDALNEILAKGRRLF